MVRALLINGVIELRSNYQTSSPVFICIIANGTHLRIELSTNRRGHDLLVSYSVDGRVPDIKWISSAISFHDASKVRIRAHESIRNYKVSSCFSASCNWYRCSLGLMTKIIKSEMENFIDPNIKATVTTSIISPHRGVIPPTSFRIESLIKR